MPDAPHTYAADDTELMPRDVPTADGLPAPDLQRRTLILDTSALMADSKAHLAYPAADVVIPLTVIDELDNNKSRSDVAGRNARDFLRALEVLRQANGGNIAQQVDLPDDASLRIEPNGLRLDLLAAHHLDPAVADHRIIAAALGLQSAGHANVEIVSNDMALRLKAAVLGLASAEHTPGRIGIFAPHRRGYHVLPLTHSGREALKERGPSNICDLDPLDRDLLADVLDNEFVIADGSALTARRRGDTLVRVRNDIEPWHLKARNKEQKFALDLMADPSIRLVALRGHAGTGKTILAIAAALEAVFEQNTHDRLMILRPMIAVGNENLGFLPGDIAEKTTPWFAAVVDALVALSGGRDSFATCSAVLAGWIEAEKVELAPLTFLRGRSLSRTFVILDEAQNVEPGVVRTVISRLGEGSTLVIAGDDGQLDQPFASALTCGLNVAVDAFAGLDLFGQVFFSKGERSRLADLAAERM